MEIKNILAVRNDRFGEFLLNIPALRALKESFPEARLTLAVSPYLKDLAGALGFADELITWDNRRHNLAELWEFSQRLKRKKFDLCVILNPSKEFNLIAFLSGIPLRLGYDRKWGFLLNRRIKDEKHLGLKHEVEYNLQLVGAIGASTNDLSLSLNLDEATIRKVRDDFNLSGTERTVALHPWTSDPVKQWPQENFYALARKLLACGDLKVIAIGGRDETAASVALFQDMGAKFIDATGKTNLPELAALLKNCRLLISCDSGPVHLASCVGVPALVLFRSGLPGKGAKRWGPWGIKGNRIIEKARLSDITVEEVFRRAGEVLGI